MTDEIVCSCEAFEDEEHKGFCEKATVTKGEALEMIRNSSAATINSYLFWIGEGESPTQAKEDAVGWAGESAACALNLGSCWGGGCKH